MENPIVIVLIIALIAALGLAGWMYMQKKRSEKLQFRFGPEYDRAVSENHGQRAAERELSERAERVEHLNIRPLSQGERSQFADRWQQVQAYFVDDPSRATDDADELVGEVMVSRGYPVGDFEQRAADVSVNHPRVVEHYRVAHTIALRNARGDADTEQLRQALVHFRALFEDLLDVNEPRDTIDPAHSTRTSDQMTSDHSTASRAVNRLPDQSPDHTPDHMEARR